MARRLDYRIALCTPQGEETLGMMAYDAHARRAAQAIAWRYPKEYKVIVNTRQGCIAAYIGQQLPFGKG